MPLNFFVTGMPKSGKTTLLRKIVDELKGRGLKVGGFLSPEERHHGTRTAFRVRDIATGKEGLLAAVDADGPKVSKYHVDVKSFEAIAALSLDGFESCDVIVVDEIGWMELKSRKFASVLDEILDSDTPLIASLHHELVDSYGPYGEVYELTGNNHEAIYAELVNRVHELRKKARKAPVKEKAAEKKVPQKKKAAPEKKVPQKKKVAPEKRPAAKKEAPRKKEEREVGKIAKKKAAEKKAPVKKERAPTKGWMEHLRELIGV